ncbi:hypothetical protein B0H66DRAFT_526148 [Apodospora peruviana]|uniref:Uncharacterized protein n=1 Tax=Apodospora peruviana TaxID=516989 RepID=A0AAE0IQM5_9PEZI|nr:hypothetical protein B0H66DRAFT_526148 [Apodospora peruviana]
MAEKKGPSVGFDNTPQDEGDDPPGYDEATQFFMLAIQSSLHGDRPFMDPVRQKESPWTASLSLTWFQDGCSIRSVNTRTVSVDYYRASGSDYYPAAGSDSSELQQVDSRYALRTAASGFSLHGQLLSVRLAWDGVRLIDKGNIEVSGLFDFYWFATWAPDTDPWLRQWHNVHNPPSTSIWAWQQQHGRVLDLNTKKLRRVAHDSLAIHIDADPEERGLAGDIYSDRGRDHIVHRYSSNRMRVSPHSIFVENSRFGLPGGNYAILLQPGSAPVVPRWERVTEEDKHKAMQDAKYHHPERRSSRSSVGNANIDTRNGQGSTVAYWFMVMRRTSLNVWLPNHRRRRCY